MLDDAHFEKYAAEHTLAVGVAAMVASLLPPDCAQFFTSEDVARDAEAVACKAEAALKADDLGRFNALLTVMCNMQKELKQVGSLAKAALAHVDQAILTTMRPINEQLAKYEAEAGRIDAEEAKLLCCRLIQMRQLAEDVPFVHVSAVGAVRRVLNDLVTRCEAADSMAQLNSELLAAGGIGATIAEENAEHFASGQDAVLALRASESGDLVERTLCDPALDAAGKNTLLDLLDDYSDKVRKLSKKLSEEGFAKVRKDLDSELHEKLESAKNDPRGASGVVQQVCLQYAVHGCHNIKPRAEFRVAAPFPTQVVAIYCLLRLENALFVKDLMVRAKLLNEDTGVPCNRIVQLLPGEGKGVTLALLAATLSLLGIDADILCADAQCCRCHMKKFKPFFEALGLRANSVRCLTLREVCDLYADAADALVHDSVFGEPNAAAASIRLSPTPRVLLVDDAATVLTCNPLCGATACRRVSLRGPEVTALLNEIFANRENPLYDVSQSEAAKAWLNTCQSAEVKALLPLVLARLVASCKASGQREWKLNEVSRRIEYKLGSMSEPDACIANETVFGYLMLASVGTIRKDEAEAHMCIDMPPFTHVPCSSIVKNYLNVLCVTSVLRAPLPSGQFGGWLLSSDVLSVLKDEFGVASFASVPSVYGSPRSAFDYAHDVHVHYTYADQAAAIEKEAFDARTKSNVLVFVGGAGAAARLKAARPLMQCALELTERTPEDQVSVVRSKASRAGAITLISKSLGAAAGFSLACSGETTVIVAELPDTAADEERLRWHAVGWGRLLGRFVMEVSAHDLQRDFYPSGSEAAGVDSELVLASVKAELEAACGNGTIGQLLESKRHAKGRESARVLQCRLKCAHEKTAACGGAPCLPSFVRALEGSLKGPRHITIALYAGGSTSDIWRTKVFDGIKVLIAGIKSDITEAARTSLTVIAFSKQAATVFSTEKVADLAVFTPPAIPATGGAGECDSFAEVAVECMRDMGAHASAEKMLTIICDQSPIACTDAFRAVYALHHASIVSSFPVAFGCKAAPSSLSLVRDEARAHNIYSHVVVAPKSQEYEAFMKMSAALQPHGCY